MATRQLFDTTGTDALGGMFWGLLIGRTEDLGVDGGSNLDPTEEAALRERPGLA